MVVRICISTPLYSETWRELLHRRLIVLWSIWFSVHRPQDFPFEDGRSAIHVRKSPGIEVEFMRCQIVSGIGWCPQLPSHCWHGNQQEFICFHLCYQSSLARNSLHINDVIDNISAKIFNSMGHISSWSSIVYCLKLGVESLFYRLHLHGWLEQRLCWFVPRSAPLPVGYPQLPLTK